VRCSPSHGAYSHRQKQNPTRSASPRAAHPRAIASASTSSGGRSGIRAIASSSACAQESASRLASAYFEGERQPTMKDHPKVPLDIRPQTAFRAGAHDLGDMGHDVLHLTVFGFVVDAEQHRVGAAETDVCRPRGLRVLLVVGHVREHPSVSRRTSSGRKGARCWWPRTADQPRPLRRRRRTFAYPGSSDTSAPGTPRRAQRSRRCGPRHRAACRTPPRPAPAARRDDRPGISASSSASPDRM
jgi:hypothetical protein